MSGISVEKNLPKAIRLFKKAIKSDNSTAMEKLAFCYQNGIGVSKDSLKAIDLYKRAADLNNMFAIVNLANYYAEGIIVDEDLPKAIQLYRKAAKLGDIESWNILGVYYHLGNGVKQNLPKAIRFYQYAVARGNVRAMNNLAVCYKNGGAGVKKDLLLAIKYAHTYYAQMPEKNNQLLSLLLENTETSKDNIKDAFGPCIHKWQTLLGNNEYRAHFSNYDYYINKDTICSISQLPLEDNDEVIVFFDNVPRITGVIHVEMFLDYRKILNPANQQFNLLLLKEIV